MISFDPASPKGIVWLASYPKSGNTWLRMFLYQLERLRRGLPREDGEINKLGRVSQSELQFFLLFEQFMGKPVAVATPGDFMLARPKVQAVIAGESSSLALIKTHNLRGRYKGVPTVSDAVFAGAIYIVRDPRDVASSLARHMGRTIDQAIEFMNSPNAYTSGDKVPGELWGSWSQNVESWIGKTDQRVLLVRYEQMLEQPAEVFAAIVAHLRQAATPDQIMGAIQSSSFNELRRQEEAHGFHLRTQSEDKFFFRGKAGAWRDTLSAAQVDAIVAAHGETMKKVGYSLNG